MISSDAQLEQALEQIDRLHRGLIVLKKEMADKPKSFAVMAEGPLDQIRDLQVQVDAYLQAETVPLWLSIIGRGIEFGETPVSILTVMLDTLRKGLQAATEYLETGQLSSRPTARIKRSSDLRVALLAPGSLRIGLRLPEEAEHPSDVGEPLAVREALDRYLQVARWVASDQSPEALEQIVPDEGLRLVILNELGRLVPRQRGEVEAVELAGRYAHQHGKIRLVRSSRDRISRVVERLQAGRIETHTGELREIDLDRLTFTLRQAADVREVPCSFPPALLQTAKDALDRRIKVTGFRPAHDVRRTSYAPVEVAEIEILDDEDEQAEGEPSSDEA